MIGSFDAATCEGRDHGELLVEGLGWVTIYGVGASGAFGVRSDELGFAAADDGQDYIVLGENVGVDIFGEGSDIVLARLVGVVSECLGSPLGRTYAAEEMANEDDQLAFFGVLVAVERVEWDLVAILIFDHQRAGFLQDVVLWERAVRLVRQLAAIAVELDGRHDSE